MENNATQMTQNEATLNEQMSARVYKQLFTDVEWDAIATAMKDYADFYGDDKAAVADKIQIKIARIYELTAEWLWTLKFQSTSQFLRIASTILSTFSTTLVMIL